MNKNKKNVLIKSRLKTVNKFVIIVLAIVLCKIVYMTTVRNSYYTNLANNKTYKQIMVQAPRGDIRDRNGVLLAGNEPEFTVQVVSDSFNKGNGKNDAGGPNETAFKIINILEKNGEKYTDEFPITLKDGKYSYVYDEKVKNFKYENGIPSNYDPKQCFYYIVDSLIKNGVLSISDRNKNPIDLQAKLNSLGYYPPILVKTWTFTEEKNKDDWLKSYNLSEKTDAKDAFAKIRKYYNISPTMSDSSARNIMLVRDLLKSKKYMQYNPVTLSKGIKESTVAQIEENSMNLSGVSVAVNQKRVYPNKTLASHVLGYVGKLPSSKFEELMKEGYTSEDMIGLSGVEHSFENKLKGKDGYKEVKVDSVGRVIEEMKSVTPKSGSTVYLTLDSKLQKVAEKSLKDAIDSARTNSTFKSQFGDVNIKEGAPNARSGAVVAIDVRNGDVLAMASYPNYDPNKFAEGISSQEYNEYLPKNKNDFLAPNPLLNLATQGAFQPGSTFKLITAMAALDSGLDPNYTINDPGVIKLGNRNFADYIWHHGGGNHGVENLYKAIQESCNVYFYCIGSDTNWMTGQKLGLGMGSEKILEYAKKFGLNDKTGLEGQLEERNGKVPSEEQKIEQTKIQMKIALEKSMRNHFKGISYQKNRKEYEDKINEIVSWVDEDKVPTRGQMIQRMTDLGDKEEYAESDADYILYSFLKFAKWGVGDTFNLAIGQGENAYNPVQISRYIAAIANGGYLVNLNVVGKTESPSGENEEMAGRSREKIKFRDDSHLKDLRIGMERVSSAGLAKNIFGNFPVKVATKTGTAQKSGKIPSDNEMQYLKSHLGAYNVGYNEAMEKYRELKKEAEEEKTKAKIKSIKEKIENPKTSREDRKKYEKELENGVKVSIGDDDRVNAIYLRKAIKILNPKITDSEIDSFKPSYGSFAWCVAYAPADNPEIAVVCVIPQGETSSYAALPIREVMAQYFGLLKEDDTKENKDSEDGKKADDKNKAEDKKDNNADDGKKKDKESSYEEYPKEKPEVKTENRKNSTGLESVEGIN